MKWRASLLLLAPCLIAAQQPDASVAGPRGTSGNGESGAYDRIERAATQPGDSFTAAHGRLPPGSVAEVTSLDNGRIVLVEITARTKGAWEGEVVLSSAAARALELVGDRPRVRVRSIQPSAGDLAALRAGRGAADRLPAPEVLLRALRREAAGSMVTLPSTPLSPEQRPATTTNPPPKKPAIRIVTPVAVAPSRPGTRVTGPIVQVAALRDEARARTVARSLDGHVERAGAWWRVRLGPFADRAAAQRARDAAVSRGYDGASIISAP